jgi:hypothetical protein
MSELYRRHSPRQNEDALIQVSVTPEYPNGRQRRGDILVAKMRNQSEDGLYIEMESALQPGLNISIKMVAPQGDHPEDAYRMHAGRVMWCKKVAGTTACFGIGIQTLRKVVQAEVMSSRFKQTRTSMSSPG